MEIENLSDYTLSNLYACRELIKMEPLKYPPTILEELDDIMKPHLTGPYDDKESYGHGYRVMGTFNKLISSQLMTMDAVTQFIRDQLSAFVFTYGIADVPKGIASLASR